MGKLEVDLKSSSDKSLGTILIEVLDYDNLIQEEDSDEELDLPL